MSNFSMLVLKADNFEKFTVGGNLHIIRLGYPATFKITFDIASAITLHCCSKKVCYFMCSYCILVLDWGLKFLESLPVSWVEVTASL